jgi:hypothetical protein
MTDCQLIEMMLLIRKHRAKRVSVHCEPQDGTDVQCRVFDLDELDDGQPRLLDCVIL